MAVCWEAVPRGRQGRKVSRARPGKGGWRSSWGGSPSLVEGVVAGMPRAKRALATLGGEEEHPELALGGHT